MTDSTLGRQSRGQKRPTEHYDSEYWVDFYIDYKRPSRTKGLAFLAAFCLLFPWIGTATPVVGVFFLCNKKKASTEAFFFTVLPYYRARYVDLVVLVDDAPEYILRDYQLDIPISIHAPLWVRPYGL